MKKLLAQIAKFGVVGVICFFIDFGIYTVLNIIFRRTGFAESFPWYYLLSKLVSVIVSMICNYLLSMKFVFTRKDDMSRKKEFLIFVVLSVIGLILAEAILYLGMDIIDPHWNWLTGVIGWWGRLFGMTQAGSEETFWVLVSTAIVMCYNFVSRKMTLEQKESKTE
ncbi:MAG: GtrA family protein [Lachnospiraceae bacterium]|nr:GtrA family protein [Lachnospiraceae bacterium]